ncbi:MAG: hypothetical protein Q8L69_01340 [Gallionellaceae bacterium]|nr:hypothetical protein [Gallionellaceae bacterium]
MAKKIIALVLILLTSGAWLYLDHLNKQELLEAKQLHKELEKARIEAKVRAEAAAKARAEAKARFEAEVLAELTACQAEADDANEAFLEANKKPVKRKPGQFTISKAAEEEAALKLETDNAACKATYDSRMAAGVTDGSASAPTASTEASPPPT